MSWESRPALAGAVRVAAASLPVAFSVSAAILIEHIVARPSSLAGDVAWWILVLGTAVLVLLGCERLALRASPLAALLEMGIVFPEDAPSRLAVAKRAGSTNDLAGRLDEPCSTGREDDSAVATERIVVLAATLSAHDRRTRGHTERVRALSDMIANELGLPDDQRDKLRWSALLHDIGKLVVHPDILNKAGPLTDEELDVIHRHPIEGARIAAPLSNWLGEWWSTIAEHHERYDGGGYPHGLAGNSISLGARIIAVADAYDVMTSTRSYRRPASPESARMEIANCAGSQFDPAVVRAFLAVPVPRLRGLLRLSWLGSLAFVDPEAAWSSAGRVGITLLAAASIVGLTAAEPLGSGFGVAASPSSNGTTSGGAFEGGPAIGGAGADHRGSRDHEHTTAGTARAGRPDGSTGTEGPRGSGGSGAGAEDDSSAYVPGPASSSPGSGTTVPGSSTTTSNTSPTTSVTSPPTTSPPPPPTTSLPTTTTTTLPPPAPATDLSASSGCQFLFDPEVTLRWDDSPSGWVTSYQILRSTNGSSYSAIGSVSRSAASYADTSVSGSTAYWYEVEAMSPEGNVTSRPVNVTTQPICL